MRQSAAPAVRYRNIDIQADYALDLPMTASDSAQMQQVFLNILNNAIDAIGKDGEISSQNQAPCQK